MAKSKKQDAAELSLLNQGAEALVIDEKAPGLMLVTDEQLIKAEADALAVLYADFTIESLRTAEDVENASADLRLLVRVRNKLDNRRKASNRATNEVAATIQGWLTPTEEKLSAVLNEYKRKEADRLKLEAEARDREIKGREAALYALGATWGGSMFQLGLVLSSRSDLEDDARWALILDEFTEEGARLAKAKADAEREAAERERVAAETTRLQNEAAAKLAEAEAKAEAAMATLRKARAAILAGLGAVVQFRLPDDSVVAAGTEGAAKGMALGDLFAARLELEFEDEEWEEVVADFEAERQRLIDQAASEVRQAENKARLDEIGASAYASLRGATQNPVAPAAEPAEVPAVVPDPVAEAPVVPAVTAQAPKFVPVHPGEAGFHDQMSERIWLSGYHAALHASRGKTADELRELFTKKRAELGL